MNRPGSSAQPDEAAQQAPRVWRRYPRRAVVPAVFIAAFGLTGGLGWQLWQQQLLATAGDSGQRAAVRYAELLTSIDSNKVDENFAAVLNGATGVFKDTYTKASVELRQLLINNKAISHGTVIGSAIQSESKSRVVALLMVDQEVTSAAHPDPRVDHVRMKMAMENVDGRWLASNVELP